MTLSEELPGNQLSTDLTDLQESTRYEVSVFIATSVGQLESEHVSVKTLEDGIIDIYEKLTVKHLFTFS